MSFVISSAQRERMAHRLIMFFFSNMVCVYRSSFLFADNIGGWLLRYFSYRTQPLTYTGNSSANLYKHVRREHIWSAMQNASSFDTRRPSLSIPNLLKQKKTQQRRFNIADTHLNICGSHILGRDWGVWLAGGQCQQCRLVCVHALYSLRLASQDQSSVIGLGIFHLSCTKTHTKISSHNTHTPPNLSDKPFTKYKKKKTAAWVISKTTCAKYDNASIKSS